MDMQSSFTRNNPLNVVYCETAHFRHNMAIRKLWRMKFTSPSPQNKCAYNHPVKFWWWDTEDDNTNVFDLKKVTLRWVLNMRCNIFSFSFFPILSPLYLFPSVSLSLYISLTWLYIDRYGKNIRVLNLQIYSILVDAILWPYATVLYDSCELHI